MGKSADWESAIRLFDFEGFRRFENSRIGNFLTLFVKSGPDCESDPDYLEYYSAGVNCN